MEKLWVVDENDRFLKFEDRKVVHSNKMWHRGVHIFVFDKHGKILLQVRSKEKDKYPGAVDCSVSEHVHAGESYEQAARRGLREELGIEAELKELLHFRMPYGKKDLMVCKLYACEYTGSVRLDPTETEKVILLSKEEIRKALVTGALDFAPWTEHLLRWFLGMDSKIEKL